jgi:hypothetical protein
LSHEQLRAHEDAQAGESDGFEKIVSEALQLKAEGDRRRAWLLEQYYDPCQADEAAKPFEEACRRKLEEALALVSPRRARGRPVRDDDVRRNVIHEWRQLLERIGRLKLDLRKRPSETVDGYLQRVAATVIQVVHAAKSTAPKVRLAPGRSWRLVGSFPRQNEPLPPEEALEIARTASRGRVGAKNGLVTEKKLARAMLAYYALMTEGQVRDIVKDA